MTNLTDSVMLDVMQVTTGTAARNISENMNHTAERFYLARTERAITSAVATEEEMKEFVETMLSSMNFLWIGLYDTHGKMIAGSSCSPEDISARAIFPKLQNSNDVSIDNTYVGNAGLEITMGLPIHREWLTSIYLVGSNDLFALTESIQNIGIGNNCFAFIIDENRVLVAQSHEIVNTVAGSDIVGRLGGGAEMEQLISMMQMRQGGAKVVTSAVAPLYISFVPISETPWSLGVVTFREGFTGSIRNAVTNSIILGIVALIISVVTLKILLSRVLTNPLQKITESATLMAQGQFDPDALQEISGRDDEVGQLGAGFAIVSYSVHQVINDISLLTQQASRGELGMRSDANKHSGDFNLIMTGINSALDAFCSHLDAMPDAFALLSENQESIFRNASLKNLFLRHGRYNTSDAWLARLVTSGQSKELPAEGQKLFSFESDNGETFNADIILTGDSGNDEEQISYYYSLTLKRVEVKQTAGVNANGFICVMLLMTDTTQLMNAKNEAEEASRAKSEFLSNMSHEMRTPMNAIIGMTAIAQSTGELERKNYCLDKIESASTHLLGVINNILDMSKIEARKFELSYHEFEFREMVRSVVDIINFRIEEKEHILCINIDEDIPSTLVLDSQRLSQVLTNLLSNSVKFTPEGGRITLEANYLGDDDNKCIIRFKVTDTGIGISKEHQLRLFDSFEQAESGISRKFGGTGLGLSISQSIIEMMGGHISVDSEPEQGAVFSFVISAERGSGCIADRLSALSDKDAGIDNDGCFRGRHILLAEDVEVNREIVIAMLENTEITIDCVENGLQAYQRVLENPDLYEMIFMDIQMPEMDGIEATKKIRALEFPKVGEIPIVAMTANVFREDIAKYHEAGMDDHLGKPLNSSDVLNMLYKYLGSAD